MKTIFALTACLFSNFIYELYKVRFEVKELTTTHTFDSIFIAGNFNNWNPSAKENSFSVDESGNGVYETQLTAGSYEYKFTRGDWNKVEVMADGKDIGNRDLLLTSDTTIYVSINGWKDDFSPQQIKKHTASPQVKIVDSAFTIPQLNRKRRVWIYLPKYY